MGFNIKTWSNPISLDSNNLNRIEQGIKNAHDTLEIHNEEISNLQHKQADLTTELNNLTKEAPSILNILEQLNSLLENNDISAVLESADNFLMKKEQTLTAEELKQVYKNLGLNKFISYNNILIDGEPATHGQTIEINSPKIDHTLNANSNNAISNKAVTEALANFKPTIPPDTNTNTNTNTNQTSGIKHAFIIRRWI